MKKILVLLIVVFLSTCCAFAAKYKVNNSGVVKSNGNTVNQQVPMNNPFNVYQSSNYVASNTVNSMQVNTIEIVMDYSGSMSSWINQAKQAMSKIMSQIPSSVSVGFRVFGHNYSGLNPDSPDTLAQVKKVVKKNGKYQVLSENQNNFIGSTSGACSATSQVASIAQNNTNGILRGMNSTKVGGATPLVFALERAVNKDFAGLAKSSPKKIVLITDGGENCGGDPCAFAKNLMSHRNDVHIDVVLVAGGFDELSCLAKSTGGKTYRANSLNDFSTVLTQSMKSQPQQVPQQTQTPTQQYEFYGN